MKTMWPPGNPSHQHSGFVATHAFGHDVWLCTKRCVSCHKSTVVITGKTHCFLNSIYINIAKIKLCADVKSRFAQK